MSLNDTHIWIHTKIINWHSICADIFTCSICETEDHRMFEGANQPSQPLSNVCSALYNTKTKLYNRSVNCEHCILEDLDKLDDCGHCIIADVLY